jgi:hypothetical protein
MTQRHADDPLLSLWPLSLRDALLSCNGCGGPLQAGAHMTCRNCNALLTVERYYGVEVNWQEVNRRSRSILG